MTLDALAEKYRLKVTRDECHHKIIQGTRGQLYADAGKACAMWLDARYIKPSRLAPLGGKQWMGDISLNERGRRLQDVKITGIAPDKIPLAIRLTGCRRGPEMTEEQREAMRIHLEKARAHSPLGKPKAAGA